MSGAEKFYEVREVCGNSGMYLIKRYVEGTGELRTIETHLPGDQIKECRVFRNGRLYSSAVTYPGQTMLLHKLRYGERGNVESSSVYESDKVYTTYFDETGNVKSTEVSDKSTT